MKGKKSDCLAALESVFALLDGKGEMKMFMELICA